MTYTLIMLFVVTGSNSIAATQVGTKTYPTLQACLDAAKTATHGGDNFSTTATRITAVGYCAPQPE
jgi:hypothetical protein